jgi:hypothetical protein
MLPLLPLLLAGLAGLACAPGRTAAASPAPLKEAALPG